MSVKHLLIPDVQLKPGDNLDFLSCIGRYIVAKKPDVVVQIGDFADMPSLSSYDRGKKSFEGRRYKADVEVAQAGMQALFKPIWEYNDQKKRNKEKQYHPRYVLTLGNHEERILRAIDDDAKLDGTIGLNDLGYEGFGWEVIPFLQAIVIDGIAYSHYFPSGVKGLPVGTARLLLTKMHMSCVAGHLQGRDIAYSKRPDGTSITALIAGSCYEHHEDYLSPQTNLHWRGLYIFHEVNNGSFDEMAVSLRYIKEKYGAQS
jgi:hypothetical protein